MHPLVILMLSTSCLSAADIAPAASQAISTGQVERILGIQSFLWDDLAKAPSRTVTVLKEENGREETLTQVSGDFGDGIIVAIAPARVGNDDTSRSLSVLGRDRTVSTGKVSWWNDSYSSGIKDLGHGRFSIVEFLKDGVVIRRIIVSIK
ncbi:MAG: hypothetical protein H0X38_01375 [Planctomycetes bacterium]|nr:hypothetical protein [Planctomycetota bacterium]